jgi:hypothetical protein
MAIWALGRLDKPRAKDIGTRMMAAETDADVAAEWQAVMA